MQTVGYEVIAVNGTSWNGSWNATKSFNQYLKLEFTQHYIKRKRGLLY
jgi:hypothetical protein